jgi:hypothetical protein
MAASTTMATVDAILKEIYEDKVRDQLQSEVITLKRIEQTSEGVTSEVGGKYVVFPIRTRRNHGIGARNENEPLPEPRSQKYASARVSLAYLYGSISLTGQTFELAEKNFQAFASALQQEIDGLKQTLVKDTNRQTYGTHFGVLATIPTGSASSGTSHTVASVQYLEVGMIVDVRSSDGATLRTTQNEITAINTTTLAVTFLNAFDSTDLDIIVRWRSYGKETIGFEEIVDDSGTLYNVDPTVEPVWKATVNHNSGTPRALSEGLMIKMVDDIRTLGGKVTVIFTTLGVRRSYFNLLSQQRRYNDTVEFEGGFKGLKFTTDGGDIPLIADVDCQPENMYFINEKELKIYRDADWSWMNRDGSNWQRVITSEGTFDAYQATMYKYCQLGTHRRNSHGVIQDIQEAS